MLRTGVMLDNQILLIIRSGFHGAGDKPSPDRLWDLKVKIFESESDLYARGSVNTTQWFHSENIILPR